jgi:hypothetical protein
MQQNLDTGTPRIRQGFYFNNNMYFVGKTMRYRTAYQAESNTPAMMGFVCYLDITDPLSVENERVI